MSLPDTASLEILSLAELRDLVGALVVEVRRLQSDNAALREANEAQQATITALRAENQALRDEVARLKGLPPRPPSRSSGMEAATKAGQVGKSGERSEQRRGPKRDRDAVTSERVLKAAVPAGSRFKGYEDVLIRELRLSAEVVRYRRERWLTPSGETVVAPLPAGIVGAWRARRQGARAAALHPGRARSGPSHHRAACGVAERDRGGDLQAPGGAPAHLAPRRSRG